MPPPPQVAGVIVRLETPRLIVTQLPPSEARRARVHHQTNDDHLTRWEPARPDGYFTDSYWEERLQKALDEARDGMSLRMFLLLKPRGEIAGVLNFTRMARAPLFSCQLGYHLGKEYQGRGLMEEALRPAVAHVLSMGLTRIEATYDVENARSGRLLDRLGFTVEGRANGYLLTAGRFHDHVLTALTRR
jgi:[ribosomal protein S5]-alanine N-acetyltransferase